MTHAHSNPSKLTLKSPLPPLTADVRVKFSTPDGDKMTKPLNYYNAVLVAEAMERRGWPTTLVVDCRTLREFTSKQEAGGEAAPFKVIGDQAFLGDQEVQEAEEAAAAQSQPSQPSQAQNQPESLPAEPGNAGVYDETPDETPLGVPMGSVACQKAVVSNGQVYLQLSTLALVLLGVHCWRVVAWRAWCKVLGITP